MSSSRSTYFESVLNLTDADAVEQFYNRSFGSVRIDDGRALGMRQNGAGDHRFLVSSMIVTGGYTAVAVPDRFGFTATTSHGPWRQGGDEGFHGDPVAFRPGLDAVSTVRDAEIRHVSFHTPSLERTARLLYAQDDLVVDFEDGFVSSPAAARAWNATIDLALTYQRAGMLGNDMIRASVYRLLAVTSLESFTLRSDRRAARRSAAARRRAYGVAAEFFHDFASLPVTVEDAAEAARVTVPELVLAFRAHSADERTPTQYLRSARLHAAKQDLIDADPTRGDTVHAIAQRWGFASPSRFAAHFRAEYGVNPKWFLDR